MPEQVSLAPGTVYQVAGTSRTDYLYPNAFGRRKFISALPVNQQKGRFTPGVYRCNPITIYEQLSSSSRSSWKSTVGSVAINGGGDVAAAGAIQLGYGHYGAQSTAGVWHTTYAAHALNKAYTKVTECDLDVGVMLGELRETIGGLLNPLSALRQALYGKPSSKVGLFSPENLKRGGRKTLDAASGTYLEWWYGILPTITSIMDIYEHVRSQLSGFDEKLHTRLGRAKAPLENTVVSSAFSLGSVTYSLDIRKSMKTSYGASVGFKMSRPLNWDERYGLSALDLAGIAWELTTLSFVLDWFVSVGSWLDAMKTSASTAVTLYGASCSQKCDIETVVMNTSAKLLGSNQNLPLDSRAYYSIQVSSLVRQCLTPGFSSIKLGMNPNALNLQKQIAAISLIWQNLPKIKRK